MKPFLQSLSPAAEFAIVILAAFGYFVVASLLQVAEPQPSFSDRELQWLVVHEAIVLALLLSFLRLRRWTFSHIGLRPTGWDTLVGLGLALATYGVEIIVWLIAVGLFPWLGQTGEAISFGQLSLATVVAISVLNPIFEEVFVCGYLMTALKPRVGMWTAINVSVALRLVYHLYQGATAVVYMIPFGLVLAYWYARTGRLWPVIVAHAAFDFIALIGYVMR
ncbi:MAG: CPBP family intramembrane glutamic endopeptidase [Hyphomicrobiaceae bacterium]